MTHSPDSLFGRWLSVPGTGSVVGRSLPEFSVPKTDLFEHIEVFLYKNNDVT